MHPFLLVFLSILPPSLPLTGSIPACLFPSLSPLPSPSFNGQPYQYTQQLVGVLDYSVGGFIWTEPVQFTEHQLISYIINARTQSRRSSPRVQGREFFDGQRIASKAYCSPD